jgi:hypothetical protein
MVAKIYCSCGKLLQIKISREGVQMRCPEHGIVWRFFVQKPDKQATQKDNNQS